VHTGAKAVLLLIDSGGVRLHEANAGLLAISEIMRAVLDVRAAGIPVIGLIGGSCGAFGGMGIVACLCNALVMSEQGRLGLSGPDVIETVAGVEEFDAKDRALVWRVTGGKHRYLMGDCASLVDDSVVDFRNAAIAAIAAIAAAGQSAGSTSALSLDSLMAAQTQLEQRRERFAGMRDGLEVWSALGIDGPERVAMLEADKLVSLVQELGR
jgi:malonate decarboxylase beta subunit